MTAPTSDKPIQGKSFIVVVGDSPSAITERDLRLAADSHPGMKTVASQDRTMLLGFTERAGELTASADLEPRHRIQLFLGDKSDFIEGQKATSAANGVLVEIDFGARSVNALASIIGLPPLFLYERAGQIILTSDLHILATLLRSDLQFEIDGVLDLCSYGFPVEYRTLFRDVRLLPGGCLLKITHGRGIETKRVWTFPPADPLREWKAFTELQMEAFETALRRMELQDSFLSLTAGLDTRAIFSALMSAKRLIPAYTLSGETPSLDAQTARALCKAYGVPHEIIRLDGDFVRNLADYAIEASRLSGGLASLGQAHQVYLYRKLPRPFAGRISGNMGNQLGRKGVEHVTMRFANPDILHPELRKRIQQRPRSPWANLKGDGLVEASDEFLFQREFTFTQIGNYLIGNSFTVQQSPYASRDLVALCYRQPLRGEASPSMSPVHLRLKDLRHRFLGEPEMYSFQRRLIHQIGGFASSYPINWGWRAEGGVSFIGALRGCLTALDAYSDRAGWDAGAPGRVLQTLRITGLHEHRKAKHWLRNSLRDFTHDLLQSADARETGLFDTGAVSRMLEEHYSGRASHHRALLLALDLALAAQNFHAALG